MVYDISATWCFLVPCTLYNANEACFRTFFPKVDGISSFGDGYKSPARGGLREPAFAWRVGETVELCVRVELGAGWVGSRLRKILCG